MAIDLTTLEARAAYMAEAMKNMERARAAIDAARLKRAQRNGLVQQITLAIDEAQDAAEVDGLSADEFARDLLAQIAHILGVEQ